MAPSQGYHRDGAAAGLFGYSRHLSKSVPLLVSKNCNFLRVAWREDIREFTQRVESRKSPWQNPIDGVGEAPPISQNG